MIFMVLGAPKDHERLRETMSKVEICLTAPEGPEKTAGGKCEARNPRFTDP